MYNNAAASDFDDWKTDGWYFDQLRLYIQKVCAPCHTCLTLSRKLGVALAAPFTDDKAGCLFPSEGRSSTIQQSLQDRHRNPYAQEYFKAFKQVKGLPLVDDIVDYQTGHGCERTGTNRRIMLTSRRFSGEPK